MQQCYFLLEIKCFLWFGLLVFPISVKIEYEGKFLFFYYI